VQPIVLAKRVVVRDPVDGGRGDVDHPRYARGPGGLEHVAGAIDVGRPDVVGGVEGECGRGVDDPPGVLHRPPYRLGVADVPLDLPDLAAYVGILERDHVERGDGVTPGEEEPGEVDAEEAGAPGDEHAIRGHGVRL
jgi:hypothetical protein